MVQVVGPKAGDIKVFVAVAVKVRGHNPHGPTWIGQTGFFGDVSEGAITMAAIKGSTGTMRIVCRIYRECVGEIDVQAAVVIVIKQGDPAAHRLHDVFLIGRRSVAKRDSARVGDVGEVDCHRGPRTGNLPRPHGDVRQNQREQDQAKASQDVAERS